METIAFRLPLPTGSSKVLSSGSQLSLGQLGHGREHRHTSKIIGSSIRQHGAQTDRGENETLLSETLSQFQVQSGEGWWDSWKLSSQVHCLGDRCLWKAGQWFWNHWLTSETRWLLLTPRPVTGRLFFPSCTWEKKPAWRTEDTPVWSQEYAYLIFWLMMITQETHTTVTFTSKNNMKQKEAENHAAFESHWR